ncbi:ROK family glucokinase [Staphylococcus pseudintermedius]|uniref:ROK family glucokinase n=1 Tax=Staphylococcus pseudintermedius TaxID=283734 RepID=UPI000BBCC3A7|nr:ROK family glucokinase [Staphylococcus pseudintermedius]EJD8481037.1 ROK family glucokinase [Staphylococcus pseudintermedius]MBU7227187.1 ROK family glucokinase [Staphylococcus pseudintermedius]MDU0285391.1 ROK family glucokinase [Staphylococcus pseudintermedius]MDU0382233.1 ROK family glucokinase [Staphylococcus pseudintermedius]PCF67688.1 glucokinase [Staphylococcus pseudintermedius]
MNKQLILAADIGGTTCKLGIFDTSLTQISKWSIETDISDPTGEVLLKQIYDAFVHEMERNHYDMNEVVGMGIGVPGPVKFESGVVNGAVNLNWPQPVNVSEIMQQFVSFPVYVDNDANVAALGEKHNGAGKDADDVVAITLGTGLGGGIIANGEIVHGHNGSGAELGHFRVDHDQRFKCNCGKSGCIETVASATGVMNLVYFYYPKLTFKSSILPLIKEHKVTAKAVFDAAKAGDQFCIFITERVAQYVAYLASIISVTTNPKYIILGGGMSDAGDILIENIKTEYYHLAFTPSQQGTEIVRAELGNDAGIVGAAGLIKTYIIEKERI